jgi:putative ABC transport system permease protein
MLGSPTLIGRSFAPGEDIPGKNAVAVVGYGLWQQWFGGDPRAIGSTIRLNGVPLTVIGVARPGFDYPSGASVWAPTAFEFDRLPKTGVTIWDTLGRLKTGLTLRQAESMFEAEVEHRSPGYASGQDGINRPRLIPLREQLAGSIGKASLVLMGAVASVLLIACANIANLLLTRVTERRQEWMIRAALGATRARLLQQLVAEGVLLSFAGAAAGVLVAYWASKIAGLAQPAQIGLQEYRLLDWRVLGFGVGIAMLTGIGFGVFPAWLVSRLQPGEDVVRSRAGTYGPRVGRVRSVLIAMQVALTLVLLAGSAVMGRGFLKLLGTDLGFRTDRVVTVSVSLAGTRYDPEDRTRQYYRDALDRLRAVPGVVSAAGVQNLPLASNAYQGATLQVESGRKVPFVSVVSVTPDYLRTMHTEVLQRREFTSADQKGSEPVVIVNQAFVTNAVGTEPVIGRRLMGLRKGGMTIIGVARTVRYAGPAYEGHAQICLPHEQASPGFMTFVARVRGEPKDYIAICRDAIQSVEPSVPVFGARTLGDWLGERLAKPRFYTTAITFFGSFALLLAVIGIYGVASYSIAQRTHEIGIRIAAGASPERVRAVTARQQLLPVAAGVVIGVAAAVGLGRFLEHLMTGAEPIGLAGCVGAAAFVALVALGTTWAATQRLIKLQVMEVLRAD